MNLYAIKKNHKNNDEKEIMGLKYTNRVTLFKLLSNCLTFCTCSHLLSLYCFLNLIVH